jgi:hypothetical protein
MNNSSRAIWSHAPGNQPKLLGFYVFTKPAPTKNSTDSNRKYMSGTRRRRNRERTLAYEKHEGRESTVGSSTLDVNGGSDNSKTKNEGDLFGRPEPCELLNY